jgi:hypothetical protein
MSDENNGDNEHPYNKPDDDIPVLDSSVTDDDSVSLQNTDIPVLQGDNIPVLDESVSHEPETAGHPHPSPEISDELLNRLETELTERMLNSVQQTLNEALILSMHQASTQVMESLRAHITAEIPKIVEDILDKDSKDSN